MFCRLFQLYFFCVSLAMTQNCRDYSQSCIDNYACCGGCCVDGICRDVYWDCRKVEDPCLDEYCPPDQECYIYQPTDCEGCGPMKECRSIVTPQDDTPDDVVQKALNSSTRLSLSKVVNFVLLCIMISITL